jgi:TonB family protein
LFTLYLIIKFSEIHRTDYYLNPRLTGHSASIDISDQPYGLKTIKSIGKLSTPGLILPKVIPVSDVVSTKETETNSGGNNDSTAQQNGDSDKTEKGSLSGNGDGIVGEVYGSAEINPKFPGGDKAMQEFIRENLHYPDIARALNSTGVIHVYFVVQYNGVIRDIKVVRGLQPDLDSEVVRVIKSMPAWSPGIRGGIPVNVRCIIPITVSPQKYK